MKRIALPALVLVLSVSNLFAQDAAARRVLTADDYARAEKMLGYNTAQFLDRAGVRPSFLPDGRFWYRVLPPTGSEFVVITPADKSRKTVNSLSELGISSPPIG